MYKCKKCESTNLRIEDRGEQKALVCNDCDKWIKWVGKHEFYKAIEFIQERNKPTEMPIVSSSPKGIYGVGVDIIFKSLEDKFFLGDTILDEEDEVNFKLAIQKGLEDIKKLF